jgi:hypothetical protein
MSQESLELVQPVETVSFQPTKEMPLDVFLHFHRLAYYTELMERVDDNHVLWDEALTSLYSEEAAEAEYIGLQNDWFNMAMEVPKPAFDNFMGNE